MKHKCPRVVKTQLADQCAQIGLRHGDTVMVHASMRSVGEILGGPDVLISAIRDTIGSDGTLMVYLGCQMPFDDIGRGIFTGEEEAFIMENLPVFDPNTARASRDFGAFAEFFRTTPGVICSRNPGCRMGAIGARAEFLTKDHPMNYGLGKGSPLERLCEIGGKVLLIGSDLDAVTLLHYAEAVSDVPQKEIVRIKVPLLQDGERGVIDIEEYNSSTGIRHWPDEFFAHIVRAFIDANKIQSVSFGHSAESYALDAAELVEFAKHIMREKANEIDKQIVR